MKVPEYLEEHGINEKSIAKFNLTEKDNRLVIPITNSKGQFSYNKYRYMDFNPTNPQSVKYTFDSGSHPTLFNMSNAQNRGYVVFTEGEIDCIKLDQEGIVAVSTTGGAATFKEEWVELFLNKNIFLCYDNDKAGIEAIKKILPLFDENVKVIELPEDIKDVCEYFAKHTKEDFILLMKNALTRSGWNKKFQPEDYKIHTYNQLLEKEFPQETWIIEKFIPQTGMVLFSGDAGAGKSFIALEIIRAITSNDIFLDHFEIKTPNVPILLIDKENGSRRLQKRLKALGVPATDQVFFLDYPEKFTLKDEAFMQSIADFIEDNKVGIVIVDSFIDILIGDENSSTDTTEVFNALRSIAPGICWILLHHEVKPAPRFAPTAINRARGSTNIKAQVDYLFSLQKTKALKVIHIEQAKARDYEITPPFAIEFQTIEETQEMGGFKYLGEVQSEITKVDEAADFVMNYVGLNPNKLRQDIIDAGMEQGIIRSSVDRAIAMLKEKKLIQTEKDPNNKRRVTYSILEVENDQDLGFVQELGID